MGSGCRIRTNPRLIVVRLDDLDERERVLLEDLRQDPDVFGVASVPSRGASLKAVNAHTVELLRQLKEPRTVSARDVTAVLLRDPKFLARLVLDDFLQMEIAGTYIGGPRALPLVSDSPPTGDAEGPIPLSEAALRYGTTLAIRAPEELAWRLYSFNTAPASPRWRTRLRGVDDLARYLDVGDACPLGSTLRTHWRAAELHLRGAWWTWTATSAGTGPDPGELSAKLYLSPTLAALPAALRLAVPVLLDHGAPTFKLGAGLHNLLRPDKFVVYFNDRSSMLRCAASLVRSLGSLDAQGVPFTASVDGSALVSWGVDPPDSAHPLKWHERDSWRTWLTGRLARYLILAAASRGCHAPWEFAVVRLGLDGVDTCDWTPEWDMWGPTPRALLGSAH
jgi:hypothetical protein